MIRFMKLVAVFAAIALSAAAATSPRRSPAIEGQVVSVLAVEVPPAPAVAGMSLR